MILQMAVENYRSIDEEQILSLCTTGIQGGHLDNVVEFPGLPYKGLKSVGVYGANGSGKSNIIRALRDLFDLISTSYRFQDGDGIRLYDPCLFNSSTDKATRISLDFTIPNDDGEDYFIYEVWYDATHVVKESLSMGAKRPVRIFVRDADCGVKYGEIVKGRKALIVPFENQLFLSVAGQRAEAPELILRVARYVRERMITLQIQSTAHLPVTADVVRMLKALKYIDVGVSDVQFEKADAHAYFKRRMFQDGLTNEVADELLNRNHMEGRNADVLKVAHQDASGNRRLLDIDEESDGTRRFAVFLPVVTKMLVDGGVLLVDELEAKMHPFMAETIVKLFNDPRVNKGQAQLIYTTHCSNLLSEDLLRRDQIWFTEKVDCRTHLFSLDDFDKKVVTPTSPYVKWYLEGRFGGVPTIDYGALVEHFLQLEKER